jgi:starch phosphorylase
MSTTTFTLELRPRIPDRLSRLQELAGNLAYAWDREIRGVFGRLDAGLWSATGNNPKLFLRRVSQEALEQAATDPGFLDAYDHALSSFDAQMAAPPHAQIVERLDPKTELVAYFCAEFGLHESLPIYSGGLGILAGDHCKAANDLGVPFVAVGLLYRQGYFTQLIDARGRQQAHAHPSNFDELPIRLCRDAAGAELRARVEVAERTIQLRIWQASIGRKSLYLLDADVPENDPLDRAITQQLYGGDTDTRIRQEIVLGIGGLRALRVLGHAPTVFHLNEGHAAFLVLERLREQVAAGLDFDSALELVAGGHVFTTHTPVPAGHDVFHDTQVRWFLQQLLPKLGCGEERLLALGANGGERDRFNMTTLALRVSRFHNGVSKIHGRVASRLERNLWPQVAARDNPIRHVTNGIHLHTFLAGAWAKLFDESLDDWREQLLNPEFWKRVDAIAPDRYVEVRQQLKRALLTDVAERLRRQLRRGDVPESIVGRATRHLAAADPSTLVLGFARRFATYKRATLILSDEARLARILNDPQRPAILIYAGKAHPKDQPAQALIQKLFEASLKPEFIGRLIVVEGYDMKLARKLVQGCDVWLNNPEYPLEASGTSGEKAGINGVVNVSVLDGWWDEGYVAGGPSNPDGPNGFAVKPVDPKFWSGLPEAEAAHRRDQEECTQLLDILEHEVVPRYYGADHRGYAADWLRISKNSMKTLIPRFNSARMVMDYVRDFYSPAARQTHRLSADGAAPARALAEWKKKVRAAWPGVSLRTAESPPPALQHGDGLKLRVHAALNGLSPEEVAVECVLGRLSAAGAFITSRIVVLKPAGAEGAQTLFSIELEPVAGLQHYRIRVRPDHPAQSHPFELGCVVWA